MEILAKEEDMGCKTMAANSALLFLDPTHVAVARERLKSVSSVAALAVLCLTKDRYYWLLIGVL